MTSFFLVITYIQEALTPLFLSTTEPVVGTRLTDSIFWRPAYTERLTTLGVRRYKDRLVFILVDS